MAEMAQESVTEHRLTPEGTQGVGYANPEKMKALNGLDKEVSEREMENGIAEEPKVNGEAESIEMKLVSESSTEKPQATYDSNMHRVERNNKPEGMMEEVVAYDEGDGGGGSKENVEQMDVVEHEMEKLHGVVKEREGRHEVAGAVESVREGESEPMEVDEKDQSDEVVMVQEREVVEVKEVVEPKVLEEEREVEQVEDKYEEVREDRGENRLENRVENQVENRIENRIQNVVQDRVENRVDNKVANENGEKVKDKVEDNTMDVVEEKIVDKVEDKVENEVEDKVKENTEERVENKVDHRAEKVDEHKEKSKEDNDENKDKEEKDNDSEKDTEKEREEGKTKDSCDSESAATETKDETNASSAVSTSASSPTSPKTLTSKPTKDLGTTKKKDKPVTTVSGTTTATTVPDDDEIKELTTPTKRTTRSATRKLMDDDDDCKITNEVVKSKYRDDESDIEMIEESDPLAISDADVKKAKQSKERDRSFLVGVSTQEESTRLCKILEILNAKGKKDPNVIIIDTNTLLKNQGNLAAAVAASGGGASSTSSVSTGTQSSVGSAPTPSMSIQTAIQAITGGMPAQGLQSAYITALQQVLLAQGGQVPMNPQHLAQLQQYYQSLGALEDDAYVIEAPSFIVPYVMEGKPKETIKDFLKRINKEHEEFEKKKKEQELLEKKKEEMAEEEAKKAEEKAEEEKKEGESDEKENESVERKETGKEDKENEQVDEAKEKLLKDKEEEKDKVKEAEKAKKADGSSEKDVDNLKKDGKESSKDEDDNKENRESKDKVVEVGEAKKEEEKKDDLSHLGRWEPYYRSALGKFFLELGLNQAEEFLQSDLLRMSKRKIEKMKSSPSKEDMMAVKILEKQLEKTRAKNAHLTVPLKTCKFCSFKSESDLVMERHLESPHMVNYTYKCNFCDFETRGPQVILFHMEAEHNVRGRLERAPAFFQCALCPYEDNNKSKMTRHSLSCAKKFKPERNCEITDWEPPAKIPKILRGRPNTLGKAFEPVRMPNLLPKGMGLSQNLQQGMASQLAAQGRGRGRPVGSYKTTQPIVQRPGQSSIMYQTRTQSNVIQQVSGAAAGTQQFALGNQLFHTGAQKKTAAQISSPKKKDYRYQLVNGHLVPMSASSGGGASTTVSSVSLSSQSTNRVPRLLPSTSTSVSLIPGLAASSSITIQPHVVLQSVQSKGGSTKSPQQPSISITPLPRNNQSSSATTKSSSSSSSNTNAASRDGSGKPSFVICEICDGYIKDLEQLRNHMNLIHKVKIHPKMIYNRPPLNCQKCQHRFFTDQGLERHLLGTHGLVTSSMQEAANKGKDAGRCPICGKVFQWKLLNHVSRDHKMTLKPAHLSYKCTVCTATFNMYRLFENHVYSAHSVVNKNKGDSNSSSSKRSGASDSPLKINDEITIIPQPASKSVKVDHKSAASKKMDSTPTVSKEITITKVGAKIQRRSGDGVEIINLDDSPAKKAGDLTPKRRSTREAAYVAAKRVKLDA